MADVFIELIWITLKFRRSLMNAATEVTEIRSLSTPGIRRKEIAKLTLLLQKSCNFLITR